MTETDQPPTNAPSLYPTGPYERLGGIDAIRPVVDEFYARVLADRELAPYFAGYDVDRIKRHQVLFLAWMLGGPYTYPGRPLAETHRGLGITSADYDRVVAHLRATLADAGAPDDIVTAITDALVHAKPAVVESPTGE
jgi:hemoglobin